MVTLLNQDLTERMDDGMFLTLFVGVFWTRTAACRS